jgi:hypothetical protein
MVEEVQEYSVGLQKHLHKEGQTGETEIGSIPRSEQLLRSSTVPCEKALSQRVHRWLHYWSNILLAKKE